MATLKVTFDFERRDSDTLDTQSKVTEEPTRFWHRIKCFSGKQLIVLFSIVFLFCTLIVTMYLSIKGRFPVVSPKRVITPGSKRFGAAIYIAACTQNLMLLVSRLSTESRHKLSQKELFEINADMRWSSYLVFMSSAIYTAYRAYFLLTFEPVLPCKGEIFIIGLSYVSVRASMMSIYASRLQQVFANTLLLWMRAFRVAVWVVFIGCGTLMGLFFRGESHRFPSGEATCLIHRAPWILVVLFSWDGIASAVLLLFFLQRLQLLNTFRPSIQKHAFLTTVSIVSTWVFSLIGSVVGIAFISLPIDVIVNSLCVHLMFFENAYLFIWMCGCPLRVIFGEEMIDFYRRDAAEKLEIEMIRRQREHTGTMPEAR